MNSRLTYDSLIDSGLPSTKTLKEIDPTDYMNLFALLYEEAPDLTGLDDLPPLWSSSNE